VRSFNELQKRWDDHVSRGRYHPCLAIKDAGLVLGAATILVRMGETRSAAKASCACSRSGAASESARCSYRDQVPPGIVKNIEKASEQWGRGEKALAHIHLAFTGLPRLESANDAYRLPPREMLAELGLGRAMRQLDKFDPDQPRVPAGSGRESGQWTKDGSLASTSAGEDHKVQLAGDVIHVGTLVGISISGAPGEIPRTTCIYESALGDFEWSRLGIWKCPSIRRVP
jgi:hypothetical protein